MSLLSLFLVEKCSGHSRQNFESVINPQQHAFLVSFNNLLKLWEKSFAHHRATKAVADRNIAFLFRNTSVSMEHNQPPESIAVSRVEPI